MENKNSKKSTNLPKVISGIDTLYYFYESNENYDDLFLEILEQLEDAKARFAKRDIDYVSKDLKVSINNQIFEYNGKAQGFYWFTQFNNYFSVGFKDAMTNRTLNDIQVQLNAIGIYTLGMKPLLQYIDDIFKEVTTDYKPITRADLNIFVQTDLSWIEKDMFVSRKRKYTTHLKVVSSKYRLQTLYIGKDPFLLRLYDKQEELKNSPKKEMMFEYYANNGFSTQDEIFNVEFELHRKYLKTLGIDTVDDLLGQAQKIFNECMEAIRLVDLSTISKNMINTANRYKAQTHPLWQHLKNSYELKDFLTIDAPLTRIKRKSYAYTISESIKEHIGLARKFYIHGGIIDEQFYDEVLEAFEKSLQPKSDITPISSSKKPEIIYEEIQADIDFKELSDLEVERYITKLEAVMNEPDRDIETLLIKHQKAFVELQIRGKITPSDIPF